ncbi:MAG TPA: hypothetical protein VGP48_12265 [Stellaceae bacterium]|jgi:hypothetical protein|nr:hypothetical protein [Stellaceae bacterium]
MPLDLDRVDQIVDAVGAMLQRRAIARELETLKRYTVEPETIDELVMAAIHASLCLDDERLPRDGSELSLLPENRDRAA